VLNIERCFHVLNSTYHKIAAGVAGEEEKELFDQGCTKYASARLSCPFLLEGACSIYQVRPYVCAGAGAVTPGEWCEVTHPQHNKAKYVKVPAITEPDMPYFLKHEGQEIISSMPFLVYRILTEGYDVLAEIPGLEWLRQVKRDENLDNHSSARY
jgi:Fe-S-cluster containining protein